MPASSYYIGLMSGTSLDGIDGVLAEIHGNGDIRTIATAYQPFPEHLREELMALQAPVDNELHREAVCANQLADLYAENVTRLLAEAGIDGDKVRAVGVHGQTIRHRPEFGYTRQINNPALIAERCGIDIIADFRNRDIAAGGQGAPLVPAFHHAMFGSESETRVVANIGGIANISVLRTDATVTGFDTGPGNVLMDFWINHHQGKPYDADGAWAASGTFIPALLNALLDEPYLKLAPPKSTGRDLFHPHWLSAKLNGFADARAVDVQATLAAFTAATLADAIVMQAPAATSVYVCGGGAYNAHLMRMLEQALQEHKAPMQVKSTEVLGVSPNHVEALAFAWLAYRHVERLPGNLPSVTGAKGSRILGALYPA
ncbi:MAG TPA: anhydro-N-acetylmuramic acid kinase [Noviherbaspirillum sp.]